MLSMGFWRGCGGPANPIRGAHDFSAGEAQQSLGHRAQSHVPRDNGPPGGSRKSASAAAADKNALHFPAASGETVGALKRCASLDLAGKTRSSASGLDRSRVRPRAEAVLLTKHR